MQTSLLRKPGAAFVFSTSVLTAFLAPTARGQAPDAPPVPAEATVQLDPIVVTGRAAPVLPAPVSVQTAAELADAPATDALDLFRRTPGAITVNFGQGDIGNPIGLRGFASAHGQDVAVFVDGVPLNVPSHAHAHGLADLGWLLPEMIERIEVLKGPFSAHYGNFALGGAINIVTKSADDNSLTVAGGSYGQGRVLGVYGRPAGAVTPFALAEIDRRHGYRDNAQYNRYNLFDKATVAFLGGTLSARVQAVARDFGAPGFLPAAGVRSGLYPRTAAVDGTDGGTSKLYDAVLNFTPGRRGGPSVTAYAGHDRLDRYADFGLPGPAPEAQTGQFEDHTERSFYGWRGRYDAALGKAVALTLGTDGQYDDGVYQRFDTVARARQAADRDRAATQLGAAAWAQATGRVGPWVTLLGGLRYDRFDIRVDNRLAPAASGRATPRAVSPKMGVVVAPRAGVEVFANVARGFRSPSAQELSPDGPDARFGALRPPTLASGDVGLKLKPWRDAVLTLDYYLTKTRDEITEQATDFVNVGATRRRGVEVSASYDATPGLSLFASYAAVRARLDGGQVGGQDYLANVPANAQTLGLTWTTRPGSGLRVVFDNTLHRFGAQPLNADRSAVGPAVVRYATRLSVQSNTPWSGYAQLTYVPNRYAGESVFDFGEPGAPDVRYAPNPVLNASVAVKYTFR